jgi:hypothetical protein
VIPQPVLDAVYALRDAYAEAQKVAGTGAHWGALEKVRLCIDRQNAAVREWARAVANG